MVCVGQGAGEDDVSVQDAAHRVGDGLVGVVALDEDGVYAGDRAFFKVPAALQQLGKLRLNRRGIADRKSVV